MSDSEVSTVPEVARAEQSAQPQPRRIMMVGGGSGGHLTPLLAVAVEIKRQHPITRVVAVGQKKENLQEVVSHESIDQVYSISAGKFRRYHGESFVSHALDVKTIALNIRDFFRFIRGIGEAWRLLGREKPDVILLKGGFVCVPVGLAARFRRIPYVTHDSDAIPGLANRITAKHARINMTAMPAEMYPYPSHKSQQVGIPLRPEFQIVLPNDQASFRQKLGIDVQSRVLCCIGGGLGAQKLNHALAHISRDLLTQFPDLIIIHVAGQKLYSETMQLYQRQLPPDIFHRVIVYDFYNNLYELSGAADVVLSRAGATSIAEFAVQAKPTIVVPGAQLTGGQQLHNARALQKADAVMVVKDGDTKSMLETVSALLESQEIRTKLSQRLHSLAFEYSAERITAILFDIADSKDE